MALKISILNEREDVYDVTVVDNHNFYANDILIHNCSEICLACDEERTAVCCLSSLNLLYWDEWKANYQFYRDVAEMLDNVLTYFIENAPEPVKKAKYSAMRERAIGIGALGFHSLLQSKNIPFESAMATSINNQVFYRYKKYLDRANQELAQERGECPDGVGYGVRHSHMTAIAPNASSSLIVGNVSPSIEPFRANGYRQDTLSGSFFHKNKYLDKIIKELCEKNNKIKYNKVWSSIISAAGSIQHLDIFDQYTKDVFKTANEIDQRWLVEHAAERQQYIDQTQSLNLFFEADTSIPYIHHVHFMAWKKGVKSLYYCRSNKIYHGSSVSGRIERVRLDDHFEQVVEEQCLACEG